MTNWKKRQVWWVTVLAVTVILGAATALPNEDATIKFVGMEYYEWSNEWYQWAADQFEASHPGITVEIETVPWDVGFERYVVWIRGGVPPDCGGGGAKWTVDFMEMGALEPLNDYMSDAFLENLVDPFIEALKFNGTYYALPIAASVRSFYYNPAIFEQAGIDGPPSNWEELEVACETIKETVPDVFPMALNVGDHEAIWNIRHFLLAAGGDLIYEDGAWKLNTPENVEALCMIKELADNGFIQPGSIGATREEVQQLFISGRAAMVAENPELINRIRERNPNLPFDVAPFPQLRAPGEQSIIDVAYLFAGSENKEAAWEFLEFLLSYDIHLDWAKRTGFFAVTEDVSAVWPTGPMFRKFVDMMPQAKMYPLGRGWSVAREELVKAVQAVILGIMEPEDALSRAEQRVAERIGE